MRFPLLFAGLLLFTAVSTGQMPEHDKPGVDPFEALLRENAHGFQFKNGKVTGKGAGFLKKAMSGVQFVAFGEVHNRRAVHRFGEAFFRLLNAEFGFQFLALEEGPYLGKMLSTAARDGGADAVLKLGLRYPNAFHMFTEEEMEMIGRIGKLSTAKTDPVWGLNQVYGAAHIYRRLVEIAPDENARNVAQDLLDNALEYEKERFQKNVHYVGEIAKPEDFKRLRLAFKPRSSPEADWLIEQVELTNRIYAPYFKKPDPPSHAFLESGRLRETNMKHLFAERYREAVAGGDPEPRVLAMFGHTHLYRGLFAPSSQFTLGNFLSEFAIFNRNVSFHIYSAIDAPYNYKGHLGTLVRAASEAAAESDAGVIIDLRPVFDTVRRQKDMDPKLRDLVISHDAFLFLRDSDAGSIERFKTPRFRWYPGS